MGECGCFGVVAGDKGVEIEKLGGLVVGVFGKGKVEDGEGFMVAPVEHEHEGQFVGDGERTRIVVEAFAENFDGIVELRGACVGDAQIEALKRSAHTSAARLIEQCDDGGEVFAVEEVLRECIESGRGVGIDGQGGAPLGFGFGGLREAIHDRGQCQVGTDVTGIELPGLEQRRLGFIDAAGGVKAQSPEVSQ